MCASLLFTSTVFTACDDDDDSSSSSEKLLKSATETSFEVNDGVIDKTKADTFFFNYTYNAEGKMTGYKSSEGITTITYKGDSIISESIGNHHIIKKEKIGTSGYIEYSTSRDSNILDGSRYIDTCFFSYNNGYLVKEITKNWDPNTATFTYENGNLITANYKWSDTEYENDSYYYTDNNTKTPILNKGGICTYTDFYRYMIGKESENLPIKCVQGNSMEEHTIYYTWTLDSDGYPVKCEQKTYDSSNVLSDYNITTYTWQ